MDETDKKPASRSGGRSARLALRTAPNFDMLPGLVGNLPLCEVMDGAAVERIDAASKHILENIGVVFRDPIALADWRRAGAKVIDERVYLDRGLIDELISTIPAEFTYHARGPKKNVRLGGRHAVSFLGPVISRAPRNIMTPTSMVTQRHRRVQSVLIARRIKSNNQTAHPKHQSSSKIDTD